MHYHEIDAPLSANLYDVQIDTVEPSKLANTIIRALDVRDSEAAKYDYTRGLLWHDLLEPVAALSAGSATKLLIGHVSDRLSARVAAFHRS